MSFQNISIKLFWKITETTLCHKNVYIIKYFIFFFNLEQWYEYNDEKVHEVDASLVENVQAYMLFYIKRDMKVNFCHTDSQKND